MEFHVVLSSFEQVQQFVAAAVRQPFDIRVGNERQHINGKDIMGMFSLDYTRPVRVLARCQEEDFLRFRKEVAQFLV